MKKLITLVAVCMMASFLPAMAGTPNGSTGNGAGGVKNPEQQMSPEQRMAKIDERIKKLEEHKARANSKGNTDIANAVQKLIDALNNLKGVAGSQNKESIKGAIEQVKTAREALMKLVPEKMQEKCNKAGGDKGASKNVKNSL